MRALQKPQHVSMTPAEARTPAPSIGDEVPPLHPTPVIPFCASTVAALSAT